MNSKLALIGLAVACLVIEPSALGQELIPIRIQVEPSGGAKLRIRLMNASRKPVTLYSSKLPWATRHSMILAAVKLTGANEGLTNTPVIDDPPPGEIAIAPGQSITGEIDLAMRFHQSWQDARGSPLLVFWSYQLQSTDGQVSNRVNGSLELTPH
jgi:hypothetical protein